jgi:hypothetical protein
MGEGFYSIGMICGKGEYQNMEKSKMTWAEWFTILLVCGTVSFIVAVVLITIFI